MLNGPEQKVIGAGRDPHGPDPQKDERLRKLIIRVSLTCFSIVGLIVFTTDYRYCMWLKRDVLPMGWRGVVIERYESKNRDPSFLVLRTGRKEVNIPSPMIEERMLLDVVELGDSLVKNEGDSLVRVFRNGSLVGEYALCCPE